MAGVFVFQLDAMVLLIYHMQKGRDHMRRVSLPVMLLLLAFMCVAAMAEEVPLVNPGFEEGGAGDTPNGWRPFISDDGHGYTISLSNEQANSGEQSVKLTGEADRVDRACIGQTTKEAPWAKAYRLTFAVRGRGMATGIFRLRFNPPDGPEDDLTHFFTISDLNAEAWTKNSFDFPVPEEVYAVGKGRIELILYQRGEGDLYYDDVAIEPLTEYTPPAQPKEQVTATATTQPPLLNPGFELDEDSDGAPDAWKPFMSGEGFEIALDDTVKRSGNRAVRITGFAGHADRAAVNQSTQAFKIGPAYRVRFYVRGEGKAHGICRFNYIGADGNNADQTFRLIVEGFGNDTWSEKTYELAPSAEVLAAGKARMEFILYQAGEGSIYYDDASVTPIEKSNGPAPDKNGFVQPLAPQMIVFRNPSFELDDDGDGIPDGWSKAIHGEGYRIVQADEAHSGKYSVLIHGDEAHGDRACIMQVSTSANVANAYRLKFWAKGRGNPSGVFRFRYQDETGDAQEKQYDFKLDEIPEDEWKEYVYEYPTLPGALSAGTVAIEVLLYQRDTGDILYDDVSVEPLDKMQVTLEALKSPTDARRMPANGKTVLQNPPDLVWPPEALAASYTLQLSQDKEFGEGTITVAGLPYNCLAYSEVLGEGVWYWRYVCNDAAGAQIAEWSEPWGFVVTEDAVKFPVPSPEELRARIPASHPRIYATADSLAEFRSLKEGRSREWWESFKGRIDNYLTSDMPVEPGPEYDMTDKKNPLTTEGINIMNGLRGLCSGYSGAMSDLAFGYLLTGDERYGRAAADRLLEITTWDPNGITGYHNHDQVFRDLAWKSACVYDWTYDLLSDEERELARNGIAARARILFKDFSEDARPIYASPYDSHGWTSMGFLGVIAIGLAGELPEANAWFDFVAATYPVLYPPWGGEEGGWCQGVSYWKWSVAFAGYFVDALASSTGLNLYDKPFYRNNGLYKLYMHPPWCDRAHFGDGNLGGPDITDRNNMLQYATLYQNPYYKWYADQIPGGRDGSIYGYWWYDYDMAARPPADLVQSHYQRDIGWVGMHSDLTDPDDIMLLFKSSWMGSFNHSHADQNSFVIYGYGEPLLIDSGYYDWYGSPHDAGWTRHTKAHNDILVNGEGQQTFDITAKGAITDYLASPVGCYTAGDATEAYHGKLSKFVRRIAYVRPDVYLIVDETEAEQPSTFTWACHALQEMEIDEAARTITVTKGDARLDIAFAWPTGLSFRQDNEFSVAPQGRYAQMEEQWHTYVETTEKSTKQYFVTLVHVARGTEKPNFQAMQSENGIAGTLENVMQAIVRTGEGPVGGSGAVFDGDMLVDAAGGFAAIDALGYRRADGKQMLYADRPVSVFARMENGGATYATVSTNSMARLSLLWTGDTTDISVDGEAGGSGVSYDAATSTLTVSLYPGEHTIGAASEIAGTMPAIKVTVGGQPVALDTTTLKTYTGGSISVASLPVDKGLYKLSIAKPETVSFTLNGSSLYLPSETVWLENRNSLEARGRGEGEIKIAFTSMNVDDEPRMSQVVDAVPDGSIIYEAETFTEFGGGEPSRYSHRTFLSGGVGMGEWIVPGMWIEWPLEVAKAGRYNLLLNGAVYEEHADRLALIDDEPLGGTFLLHRFDYTGGYGSKPEEWKNMIITGADGKPLVLYLAAGEHTLRMFCAANRLNLDYIALVPVD